MTDKFILSIDNFERFNNLSDFPLTKELVYSTHTQFKYMKSFFNESYFHFNFKNYLLYKQENNKYKIINGNIEVSTYVFPFKDLSSLPSTLNLKIIKVRQPQDIWLYKTIHKKDLKLFLDILDITEDNIKVILE